MSKDAEKAVELLPCPFCGAIPEFGWRTNLEGVPCRNDKCGAEGPSARPLNYYESIKLWNTRSGNSLNGSAI